ncbi:Uncharacterised protein [uncultured archaeon]|nr:Uncharacterised protein [uncultured archaeon]
MVIVRGEWSIQSHELENIRRIEMEVHNFDGNHDFSLFYSILKKAGFEYEKEIITRELMLIQAKNKKLTQVGLLSSDNDTTLDCRTEALLNMGA